MTSARHSRSDLWYRVRDARPRLRAEAVIERHVVRDRVWYVVRDRLGMQTFRFSPAVHAVLIRMNGRRTLDRIWHETTVAFGDAAPAQDQILSVVAQLHAADLLLSDRSIDVAELAERAETHARRQRIGRFQNPMYLRFPLIDPDRFLSATVHLVRPFAGPLGAVLWLALMIWFGTEALRHGEELTADVTDRLLIGDNLLLLLLVYPALKLLHEFGHGYAVKLCGREVHELGVMLLTFMPSPYVDASAAALEPSRFRRAMIGAAGMVVELVVAAGAMAVWLAAEPGLVRAVAFDVMLVASVSTVLVNGNPLLRFDGYYILCDLADLPNLASRSARYWAYLVQRWGFGLTDAASPVESSGEGVWLFVYGPASFVYRLIVVAGIAVVVGSQYFFFGVLLGLWLIGVSVVWPVLQSLRRVLVSPALERVRARAVAVTMAALAVVAFVLGAVPVPEGTVARGVVWVPEDTRIVAEATGRIERVVAPDGAVVAGGDLLLVLDDPAVVARREGQQARIAELRARLAAAEPNAPVDLVLMRRELAIAENELDELRRREANLEIRAPAGGRIVYLHAADLVGSWAHSGDLLGHVGTGIAPVVRVAVPESEIDRVRSATRGIVVRLDGAPFQPIDATLGRQMPEATHRLPSLSLASANGGPFALDPTAKAPDTAVELLFLVDVGVNSSLLDDHWGERAHVRFDHGAAPVMQRLYRTLRQVFMDRFHA